MKSYTLEEVAKLVDGRIKTSNKSKEPLRGLSDIRSSEPYHLTFCAKKAYEEYIYTTGAGAVLVSDDFSPQKRISCALIRVSHVYEALRLFLESLDGEPYLHKTGTEEPSYLGKDCQLGQDIYRGAFSYIGDKVHIGERVQIYPHVYIGDNVRIGSDSKIYAGAYIHSGVQIGKKCVIKSAAVLGSNGFGYAHAPDGSQKYIPQIGQLIIEDDVHIGANSSIDRATFGTTRIETGVRIDNQVTIGHNAEVGAHTIMCGQSGLAGSVSVGPYCAIGGQAGVKDNIRIAKHTTIGGQSGVGKSIEKTHTFVIGSPATDIKSFMSRINGLNRLEYLERRLKELEGQMKSLSK